MKWGSAESEKVVVLAFMLSNTIVFAWEGWLLTPILKIFCLHITGKCKGNRIFQELCFGNTLQTNWIRLILFFSFPPNSLFCFAVGQALEKFYSVSVFSCAAWVPGEWQWKWRDIYSVTLTPEWSVLVLEDFVLFFNLSIAEKTCRGFKWFTLGPNAVLKGRFQ